MGTVTLFVIVIFLLSRSHSSLLISSFSFFDCVSFAHGPEQQLQSRLGCQAAHVQRAVQRAHVLVVALSFLPLPLPVG